MGWGFRDKSLSSRSTRQDRRSHCPHVAPTFHLQHWEGLVKDSCTPKSTSPALTWALKKIWDKETRSLQTKASWPRCGPDHWVWGLQGRQSKSLLLEETPVQEVVTQTPQYSPTLRDAHSHLGGPKGSAVLGVQGNWKLRTLAHRHTHSAFTHGRGWVNLGRLPNAH